MDAGISGDTGGVYLCVCVVCVCGAGEASDGGRVAKAR